MPLNLPEPDDTRLTRSPLELVVCQIRYENHPELSEGDAAIAFHEALGGADGPYPRLDVLDGQAVGVTVGPTAAPSLETQTLRGWRMTSSDGAWVVSVQTDHVALETSAYTTWAGDFEERLGQIIDATVEHIKPKLVQRLGLRYVDRIKEFRLESPGAWERYIRPELLGPVLHPDLGDAVVQALQLLVLRLDGDVACNLRHGPLPPEDARVDYLLDYDIVRQGGRRFDAAGLKAEAARFNRFALQLFHASVLEALLEELR